MNHWTLHQKQFRWIGAGVIWLFHLSGLIGIRLGHFEWFAEKTPLNLCLSLLIFVFLFPLRTGKQIGAFFLISCLGMAAEWMGVHWGWFFGDYAYGDNFGPKFQGVPYLIGLYWALLTLATYSITRRWIRPPWGRWILAALMMTGLDFLLEQWAPKFDFWVFDPSPPIQNYISWFLLGLALQLLWERWGKEDNYFISAHLLLAQLVFFSGLFLI